MDRYQAFCVPPPRRVLPERWRLCIIADGNTRHGGHQGGKTATVRIAEHCAERGDVELLVVCVLSLENIEKRPESLFIELEQLFLDLGVEIATRGVLLRAGIRCGVYGDLGLLRARGGAAARFAGMLDAISARTASLAAPRAELLFAVGYSGTMTEELDLHAVIRTGMEESGALRLSGINAHHGVACLATRTLYPDFGPADLDEALVTTRQAFVPSFAPGYGIAFISELIAELERAPLDQPVRLIVPTAAPPAEVTALLLRSQAAGLCERALVGVEYSVSPTEEPHRYGPPWETGCELLLFAPAARHAYELVARPAALIAAGQEGSAVVLPGSPPIGHANVFGSENSPAGVIEALRAAARFAEAHPPLLGADRMKASAATSPAHLEEPWPSTVQVRLQWLGAHPSSSLDELAAIVPTDDPREAIADACAAKMLHAAAARGLHPRRRALWRAFLNYQMTAIIMCHAVDREDDPRGERWLEAGTQAADVMSSVALSDEEIFDRPTPNMSAVERRRWLNVVAGYLGAAARDSDAERPRGPAPDEIEAIAALWGETRTRFQDHAHPTVFADWCKAVEALYRANLDELDPEVADNPLLFHLRMVGHPRRQAVMAIEARYATSAPDPVAARIRQLLTALVSEPARLPAIVKELAVWMFLGHTNPSIAGGLLFRHLALLWPAAVVTQEMAASLDRVAGLLNYRYRLLNDLSALRGETGLDRDGKPNAWTILVPAEARGVEVANATIDAIALCRGLDAWLEGELERALAELAHTWPSLARFVRRGCVVGVRVYQGGHYATAEWSFMHGLLREVDDA